MFDLYSKQLCEAGVTKSLRISVAIYAPLNLYFNITDYRDIILCVLLKSSV
jgi:hypothetical protein